MVQIVLTWVCPVCRFNKPLSAEGSYLREDTEGKTGPGLGPIQKGGVQAKALRWDRLNCSVLWVGSGSAIWKQMGAESLGGWNTKTTWTSNTANQEALEDALVHFFLCCWTPWPTWRGRGLLGLQATVCHTGRNWSGSHGRTLFYWHTHDLLSCPLPHKLSM